VGTIGAGGGMCANARDELRRPGFKGGGEGSPFVGGAVRTAAAATGIVGVSTFFKAVAAGLALGKVCVWGVGTDLGTDVCTTFVAGFLAAFTAVFALTTVLGTG